MCTLCATPTRPFVGPSRLLAGKGASAGCADELRALGVLPDHGSVLLVADSAVLELGLHTGAQSSLEGAGFQVLVGAGGRGRTDAGQRALAAPGRRDRRSRPSLPSAAAAPSTPRSSSPPRSPTRWT